MPKNQTKHKLLPATFRKRLLTWFNLYGRTLLPWQQNKNPYRVWVSEVMLQQTQVSTVIPYFQRFITLFPSVAQLANAHEDQVLHEWSGLGYYSRARNLHKAAQLIMTKFSGNLPGTLAELKTLPGIGASTAGAILSLGFNRQATILDGNVKRVLARLHGIDTPIDDHQTLQQLWQLANDYAPKRKHFASYSQAIMDLGALICTPNQPKCLLCPLQKYCVAYADGIVAQLPRKKMLKKKPVRKTTFVIFKHGNNFLLQKRVSSGIWGGLFCFPEMTSDFNQTTFNAFCRAQFKLKTSKLNIHCIKLLDTFRHSFTHYHLDIAPLLVELDKFAGESLASTKQIWYNFDKEQTIGLPKPVQTLMRTCRSISSQKHQTTTGSNTFMQRKI